MMLTKLCQIGALVAFVSSSAALAEPKLRVIAKLPSESPSFGASHLVTSHVHPTLILSADWGGHVSAYDLRTKTNVWSTPFAERRPTKGMRASPDGRFYVAGSDTSMQGSLGVSLYDYQKGEKVRHLELTPHHRNMNFLSFAFTEDGQFIASGGSRIDVVSSGPNLSVSRGSMPAPISLHRVDSGKFIKLLEPGIRNVHGIGFSQDGALVYAMGTDEFGFWNVSSGQRIKVIHLADIFGESYRQCDQFEGCGFDRRAFISFELSPSLQFGAITTGTDVIIINLESQKVHAHFQLPDQLFVRKFSLSDNLDTLYILATGSYRVTSKTVLFRYDIAKKAIAQRIEGEEMPGAYGINPFNPGATIAFINDHRNIVTLDGGEFHVPLRIPVLIWAWD